jgi:hypothetical protein
MMYISFGVKAVTSSSMLLMTSKLVIGLKDSLQNRHSASRGSELSFISNSLLFIMATICQLRKRFSESILSH